MATSPLHHSLRRVAVTALALGMVGCGAAASQSPAPMNPPGAAPSAAADAPGSNAIDELDRSERELTRALARPGDKKKAEAKTPQKGGAPKEDAGDDERDDLRACDIACRALASMDRAAQHLCELAGDGDARCQSARDRVDRARQRVVAECAACSGG